MTYFISAPKYKEMPVTTTRTRRTYLRTFTTVIGVTVSRSTDMPSSTTGTPVPDVMNTPQTDTVVGGEPKPTSSTGLIVVVTIGVVVFSLMIACVLFGLIKQKRKRERTRMATSEERPRKHSLYSLRAESSQPNPPSQHDLQAIAYHDTEQGIPLPDMQPSFAQRPQTIATTVAGTIGYVQTAFAKFQQEAALKERERQRQKEEEVRKQELLQEYLEQQEVEREHRESLKCESSNQQAEQEEMDVASLVDRGNSERKMHTKYPEGAFSLQGVLVEERHPDQPDNFLQVPQHGLNKSKQVARGNFLVILKERRLTETIDPTIYIVASNYTEMQEEDMKYGPVDEITLSLEDLHKHPQETLVPLRHPNRRLQLESRDTDRLYQQLQTNTERAQRLAPGTLDASWKESQEEMTSGYVQCERERGPGYTSRNTARDTHRPVQRAPTDSVSHRRLSNAYKYTFDSSAESLWSQERGVISSEKSRSTGQNIIRPTRRAATEETNRQPIQNRYEFDTSESSGEEKQVPNRKSRVKEEATDAKLQATNDHNQNPSEESFYMPQIPERLALSSLSFTTMDSYNDVYKH